MRGLGEQAELIVPAYGVVVHGVSKDSISMKDQTAAIQQMLADNYRVIPSTEISYVGWLTKEATLKQASSIAVEFTDPEMANAIIYAGMVWEGQVHQCQLYDRACRMKQCFRCYSYGHIGTPCTVTHPKLAVIVRSNTRPDTASRREPKGSLPNAQYVKMLTLHGATPAQRGRRRWDG